MKTKALDRVSVEIPLKSSISIVGRNGSGKSTLIKLLLRLYQPDEGRIFLDGVDIWAIPLEKYRQQVSAVFQDYYIFALDIRENITVAGQNDEKVWEALRKAGVENTVQKLPKRLIPHCSAIIMRMGWICQAAKSKTGYRQNAAQGYEGHGSG